MAPKKPATEAAPAAAKPKANTKVKVTKPAAAKSTKTTTTAKAGPTKKAAPATKAAASKPAAKKSTAPKKAVPAKPAAKPAAKKIAAPKTSAAKSTATKRKRSADDDEAAAPVSMKKVKLAKKGVVINEVPTQRLNVYVFGEGTAGELGLGTAKNAVDVKRPRLNPNLDPKTVGVVQVVAGGMHVLALTHDNRVLSWGVNDQGALGRNTDWDGGLKDMDENKESDDDSDDDEDDNGLNPHESTPGAVDFSQANLPEGTRFVQVAAGDSISLALTDDGRVYGWGTFRSNEGPFGFDAEEELVRLPKLIPSLKKITQIKTGANHALALTDKGSVFAWGSGQQNQLGRRVVERVKSASLVPREFGLPKGDKKGIKSIETGAYHSFAISKNGDVYTWGLNNFGETGITENAGQDDAVVKTPTVVESLKGKNVIQIHGGSHHTIAATADGDCLAFGRIDGGQLGISKAELSALPEDSVVRDENGTQRILAVPTKVSAIQGKVVFVATSSDHNIALNADGKAFSWGFSANYQTGLGTLDDVIEPTMIDNTAVREQKLNGACTGGQFSIVTSPANI